MQFEEMCCKNAVALKKNAISKNVSSHCGISIEMHFHASTISSTTILFWLQLYEHSGNFFFPLIFKFLNFPILFVYRFCPNKKNHNMG